MYLNQDLFNKPQDVSSVVGFETNTLIDLASPISDLLCFLLFMCVDKIWQKTYIDFLISTISSELHHFLTF